MSAGRNRCACGGSPVRKCRSRWWSPRLRVTASGFSLVSSATELTRVEMVEGFAGRFRQEACSGTSSSGWVGKSAGPGPRPRSSDRQVQWVTLSLLRLAQFRLAAEGSTDWWLRPPWNRKKDRPSVLDVERLLRRHGSEIRNLLAKWLGKEEGAAREPAAGAAWGSGEDRWPGRLGPEIRPLPSESGGNEGEAA